MKRYNVTSETLWEKVLGYSRAVRAVRVRGRHDSDGRERWIVGAGDPYATQTVQGMPDAAKRKAGGNPLAVGLIALGAGWLLGSLLPASEKERQVAEAVQEKAQPLVDQATEGAKAAGQEMVEHLKEPTQQAAQEVKDSAQESAETVKSEGRSTATDVKESGQQAKDTVQESHRSGS